MLANLLAASRGSNLGLCGGKRIELLIWFVFTFARGSVPIAGRNLACGIGLTNAPNGSTEDGA